MQALSGSHSSPETCGAAALAKGRRNGPIRQKSLVATIRPNGPRVSNGRSAIPLAKRAMIEQAMRNSDNHDEVSAAALAKR
jgi:hypothetical protein